MRKPTKQQIIERLERENASLRGNADQFGERLNEARRRTVPLQNGDADINFLPRSVTKVDFARDVRHLHGMDGFTRSVAGMATATIVCEGDVIISPNQSQPAKRAGPKVPPHDLGWKILNECADSITDKAKQNCFIADCRPLEGGFTSGHITEETYRFMLKTLIPK